MSGRLDTALPTVSPTAVRLFSGYSRHYIRRRFHSVRILESGLPPDVSGRPVVLYLNHSSWWDPLVCLLLSRTFFADRTSYGPIDADMLERYAFFKRLGFFGVSSGDAPDTLKFLRTVHGILRSGHNALWITPQGRFADARERPPRLRDGLGAIAVRTPSAAFVPLSIEYPFWTEPQPEILVSFGNPIIPTEGPPGSVGSWTARFSEELESVQDALAAASCRRAPQEWKKVDSGRRGVNLAYDCSRWVRARLRGKEFNPEHHVEVAR